MGCFIVPAVGAAVSAKVSGAMEKEGRISFARKLGWLTKLLAGGSALLAFEHFWHGEIVPYFPFLTSGELPHEMATAGVSMLALVTLVWAGMLAVSSRYERELAEER